MLLSKSGRIYNIRDNLMIMIMIRWVKVSIKPRQKEKSAGLYMEEVGLAE